MRGKLMQNTKTCLSRRLPLRLEVSVVLPVTNMFEPTIKER